MKKPRVFIASSSEASLVAEVLQEKLSGCAECYVWNQVTFEPSGTTISSLTKELDKSDYGIFVCAFDDVVRIREDAEKHIIRDNVIFELGLFAGRLGLENCFAVVINSEKERTHIPTDLAGVTEIFQNVKVPYDYSDLRVNLTSAANQIKNCIEEKERSRINITGRWLHIHNKDDLRVGIVEFTQVNGKIKAKAFNVTPNGISKKERRSSWRYNKCYLQKISDQDYELIGVYDASSEDSRSTNDGFHRLRIDSENKDVMYGVFQDILDEHDLVEDKPEALRQHVGILKMFRVSPVIEKFIKDHGSEKEKTTIKSLHKEESLMNEPYVMELNTILSQRASHESKD